MPFHNRHTPYKEGVSTRGSFPIIVKLHEDCRLLTNLSCTQLALAVDVHFGFY